MRIPHRKSTPINGMCCLPDGRWTASTVPCELDFLGGISQHRCGDGDRTTRRIAVHGLLDQIEDVAGLIHAARVSDVTLHWDTNPKSSLNRPHNPNPAPTIRGYVQIDRTHAANVPPRGASSPSGVPVRAPRADVRDPRRHTVAGLVPSRPLIRPC